MPNGGGCHSERDNAKKKEKMKAKSKLARQEAKQQLNCYLNHSGNNIHPKFELSFDKSIEEVVVVYKKHTSRFTHSCGCDERDGTLLNCEKQLQVELWAQHVELNSYI